MLIVLPPSETKSHGGQGPAIDFEGLSFPSLNPIREDIAEQLASLAVDDALEVLGISEKLRAEAESNTQLFESPTTPAILRYTGVLYDALNADSLSDWSRLSVGSALFGVVGAADLIPHYRLSGGTKLGGRTLKSRWGSAITDALDDVEGLVLDFRSGTYQNLGKLKRAITLRVETPDGKVVSHFNKHYKGVLARELATAELECIDEVVDFSRAKGFELSADSATQLRMVV